ncbi:MAG: type II toxin-antitoxin system HicA family toxin [Desulfobacterales bacterium]|nr:type II toxin-antitoxin system HicA family toxin [Desulfobacterales bacterium]
MICLARPRAPISANIKWKEVFALLKDLGAEIIEREGSRIAVVLDGEVHIQHKPHPSPCVDKGAVADLRDFLKNRGIEP